MLTMTESDKPDRKLLFTPEEKTKRFKRVAERRVNRILEDLRLLGNTSNKSLYKYDESDIDKIFASLEQSLREVRGKFRSRKNQSKFRLD